LENIKEEPPWDTLGHRLILLSFGVLPAPGVNEKEFLIKDFAPQGEVKGRAEIKAVFNREAAPESSIGKPLPFEDLPFKFTPAIRGTGKWVDARTFVYYPSAGMLEKATLYTATARSDLRDREGLPLSGKQSFLFNTAPPVFSALNRQILIQNAKQSVMNWNFHFRSHLRGSGATPM
jgi:hypothetical protein